MEQIRSFIAIELPDDIRAALAELQTELQTNNQPQVKWVDPHGIHLTLKFLGSIATRRNQRCYRCHRASGPGLFPSFA